MHPQQQLNHFRVIIIVVVACQSPLTTLLDIFEESIFYQINMKKDLHDDSRVRMQHLAHICNLIELNATTLPHIGSKKAYLHNNFTERTCLALLHNHFSTQPHVTTYVWLIYGHILSSTEYEEIN